MPSYVVKINKEDDWYVIWSTVTDSPHMWGDREDVTKYLSRYDNDSPENIVARFERADATGTSAFHGDMNWGDGFMYKQEGILPRERLGDFLRSSDPEEQTFDLSLLAPFEDE